MIEKVSALSGIAFTGAAPALQSSSDTNISTWLESMVIDSNDKIQQSEQMLLDLTSGKAVSTHEVMLVLEQAKLQLSLFSEIRNKLTEGYQELMRMQI